MPEGYRSKDLDRLIRFLADEKFVERLPQESLEELTAIAQELLGNSEEIGTQDAVHTTPTGWSAGAEHANYGI